MIDLDQNARAGGFALETMSETFSNRSVQLEDREFAQKADDVFQVKSR